MGMSDLTRFLNPMTTRGDLIAEDSTPKPSRLAIGSANSLLSSNGSDPAWATLSAILDAAIGSTRDSVLYRGASGWAILAPGTSGYALASNGSAADPSYQQILSGSAVNASIQCGSKTISNGMSTPVLVTGYLLTSANNGCTVSLTNGTITILTAGTYSIYVSSEWDINGTGSRDVRATNNGTAINSTMNTIAAVSGGETFLVSAGMADLAVNDVIDLRVMQSSGGNLTLYSCNLRLSMIR